MKQFWLEVLEEIRSIGLIRMFKCCFIVLVQGVWWFVRIAFGCLLFLVMICVIYQNGWISCLGHGEVSAEMFQTSFLGSLFWVFTFYVTRKLLLFIWSFE